MNKREYLSGEWKKIIILTENYKFTIEKTKKEYTIEKREKETHFIRVYTFPSKRKIEDVIEEKVTWFEVLEF